MPTDKNSEKYDLDNGTFAERLKAARKKVHLTGKNVAEITGMNYQTYMSYEMNKNLPSAENLIKISNALGVSTDYLLKGYDAINETPKLKKSHVIQLPTGSNMSDISPLIDEITEMLRLDKNVNFEGKPLDAEARKLIFIELCLMQSDLVFGESDVDNKILGNKVKAFRLMHRKAQEIK